MIKNLLKKLAHMKNDTIEFSGKKYILDIDAIMKWCLNSNNTPTKETEINEGYDTNDDGELVMLTKVIRESKAGNIQDDTVRYDFIKILLTPFLGEIMTMEDITESFSYTMLFNTLIKMGFLVEII